MVKRNSAPKRKLVFVPETMVYDIKEDDDRELQIKHILHPRHIPNNVEIIAAAKPRNQDVVHSPSGMGSFNIQSHALGNSAAYDGMMSKPASDRGM